MLILVDTAYRAAEAIRTTEVSEEVKQATTGALQELYDEFDPKIWWVPTAGVFPTSKYTTRCIVFIWSIIIIVLVTSC